MGNISPNVTVMFIDDECEEHTFKGSDGLEQVINLLRKLPAGRTLEVYWDNSESHRRNPGGSGTWYYTTGPNPRRTSKPT